MFEESRGRLRARNQYRRVLAGVVPWLAKEKDYHPILGIDTPDDVDSEMRCAWMLTASWSLSRSSRSLHMLKASCLSTNEDIEGHEDTYRDVASSLDHIQQG